MIKVSLVVLILSFAIGSALYVRQKLISTYGISGNANVSDNSLTIDEAKHQVARIASTLMKTESVLISAKLDRASLVAHLKDMGIKVANEVKGNIRAKHTAEDLGRVTNEIDSLEKKVALVATQLLQAKAIVRRMEMEQSSLSEDELTQLSQQIHETDISSDGFSQSISPMDLDQTVNDALNNSTIVPIFKTKSEVTEKMDIVSSNNFSFVPEAIIENSSRPMPPAKGMFDDELNDTGFDPIAHRELRTILKGFPHRYIKASVEQKPEIIETSSIQAKIKVTIKFEVDTVGFKKLSKELLSFFKKQSKQSKDFTIKSKRRQDTTDVLAEFESLKDGFPASFLNEDNIQIVKPKITIAIIEEGRTAKGESADYRGFILDESFQRTFMASAFEGIEGKLRLINHSGETVITERFDTPNILACLGKSKNYRGEIQGISRNSGKFASQMLERSQLFLFGRSFVQGYRFDGVLFNPIARETFPLSLSIEELKSVKEVVVDIRGTDQTSIDL